MLTNKPFHCILAAFDGTPAAVRIVNTAMALAQSLSAKLIVLGVVPPLSADAAAEGWGLAREQQFAPQLQLEMQRLTAQWRNLSIVVSTEIAYGDPDDTIEQRARSADIDLVVVGHRTLTRVQRWFEGKSTAEGLVSGAQTSVLVIPELEDACKTGTS